MSCVYAIATAVAVLGVLIAPARSSAQTSLDGFGALSDRTTSSSLGDSGFPVDFGGRVSFDVVPAVQVFGEFGRIGNVMPTLVETGLAFTRLDLTASAFYGEGGVRLLAAPRSAVSPYVEGTAGVAHLRLRCQRVRLDDRCAHSRGVEPGRHARSAVRCRAAAYSCRAGPLRFDLGYRYKRILANSAVSSVLGVGQELQSHQVRFGVGVRF